MFNHVTRWVRGAVFRATRQQVTADIRRHLLMTRAVLPALRNGLADRWVYAGIDTLIDNLDTMADRRAETVDVLPDIVAAHARLRLLLAVARQPEDCGGFALPPGVVRLAELAERSLGQLLRAWGWDQRRLCWRWRWSVASRVWPRRRLDVVA